MDGYFCLKWNNHGATFLHNLKIIHDKNLYCDATIACQGQYYPVHKFVLATCSDYFKDIFKEVVCKHPFIILKDINPKDLEALLDYMYKGEVNVIQETILGLIEAAEALKIKGLAVHDNLDSSKSNCGESPSSNRDLKRSLSPSRPTPISPNAHSSFPHQENLNKKVKTTEIGSYLGIEVENVPETQLSLLNPLSHSESKNNSEREQCIAKVDEEVGDPVIKNELKDFEDKEQVNTVDLPNDEDSFDDNSVNFFNAKKSANGMDPSHVWDDYFFPESHHSIFRTNFDTLPPQCSTWNVDESSENNNKCLDGSDLQSEVMRQKNKNKADAEAIGKLFSKSSLLKKLSSFSGNVYPRLQCSSCPYKCKKEISMQRHKVSKHFSDKPEITEEEEHEKSHKDLKCCYCTYTTIQPSRLKSHMSIHTGYKPYSCTYCLYKSSQSGTMKRHIQNVHKDKFNP